MFWEKKLSQWVEDIRHRSALPLRLELWNGQQINFSAGRPDVTIRVPHFSAINYLVTPSLASLGEAYVEGKIEIEGHAAAIIRIGSALAGQMHRPASTLSRIARSVRHDKQKDAEAIRYHYDVSNAFYQSWLDENLVYSCAYFENGDEDLATAQIKKIDHILTKIQLKPGNTLLDIGCGWGALTLRAAQQFGAKCVGITLSRNQYEFARERIEQAGLSNQIEIRLQDYRDLTGSFDRITSVGMFEHVGLQNLPHYFTKIRTLLAEDGLAMNHGITSTDPNSVATAYGGGAFIDKYVFPQGELPHLGLALKAMQEGGLEVLDIENLRRHYARTCSIWADNFETNADRIKMLTDDRHYRIWRVYLAGCAHAFTHDWISVYQVVCTKAGRNASALPWSRKYIYK